ncbi:DUF2690 domain-containing protein [Streptomyces sp. NBC_01565]|uniref:DUF2690 domain-containing protein n=1 Tax=unclassified Streptomyces TaxID=2593676 RepID=UPI0022513FDB|nr:DUF2690 domain-containing protein [Streptomyces sp. NBC_01565]MCX4546068.1 YjfA family protein [Streptomyces sp. NBC_01565]
MQITKRAGVLTAGVALLAGLGLTGTAAQAAPSGAAACSTSNAVTKRTASVDSIQIELRYSTSSRCAWGRIYSADPGDKVWVDRSSNGGGSWEGPMGMTTVNSGSDTHTPAYNDAGFVMRACAWNDTTTTTRCTGWY